MDAVHPLSPTIEIEGVAVTLDFTKWPLYHRKTLAGLGTIILDGKNIASSAAARIKFSFPRSTKEPEHTIIQKLYERVDAAYHDSLPRVQGSMDLGYTTEDVRKEFFPDSEEG